MIEANGCKLEFLPPYSPDFNPIEYSFSVIKSALKGNHQMHGNEDFDELAKLLGETVKSRITPEIAANQFRTCRIPL
jgi:transposase